MCWEFDEFDCVIVVVECESVWYKFDVCEIDERKWWSVWVCEVVDEVMVMMCVRV